GGTNPEGSGALGTAVDRNDHRGLGLGVGHHPHRQPEDLLHQAGGDDLRGCALGDDRAVLHHHQVGGVAGGVVEVVQDRHEGVPAVVVQVGAQVEHVHLVGDVEVGGG